MGKDNNISWWKKIITLFKGFCRLLIIDGYLLWLFLLVLAVAIYTPLFLNISDQVTFTASILQVFAFIFIGFRLNEFQKHYDPEDKGFWEAIIRWGRRFSPKDVEVNVNLINQSQSLTAEGSIEVNRGELSNKERIELLEKDLKKVKDDLNNAKKKFREDHQNLERKLMDELKEVEIQQKTTEKKAKELHLQNLGRELVAVLWLISAAVINGFPELIQFAPFY